MKLTVYVRSAKVQVGETLVEELYPVKRGSPRPEYFRDTVFRVKLKKKYGYFLPEDQKALVDVVKRLSERRGLELKIIDVSREDAVFRLWKRLRGIRNFPVVETSRGDRLQAPFSQGELERFVLEAA